jgi:integrase
LLNIANDVATDSAYADSLLERKVNLITEGLSPTYSDRLYKISRINALAITDFILSMKTEINLSNHHIMNNIMALTLLAQFYNNEKYFTEMGRIDILSYLNRLRRPEAADPLHKWIGSYNMYKTLFVRFFKWLYYPDVEAPKRPKPAVVENIPNLKRKEQSIYKPSDLWTEEDDLLFLKYCPSKRDKCYHMISRDTGCRPHEILNIRIKDVVFKIAGNRQYAEVLVNGKTGSRHIPLINSLPYLKDWLDEHPQQGNPNVYLICGYNKSLGRHLKAASITKLYGSYKYGLFYKLALTGEGEQMLQDNKNKMEHHNISEEDKQRISNKTAVSSSESYLSSIPDSLQSLQCFWFENKLILAYLIRTIRIHLSVHYNYC